MDASALEPCQEAGQVADLMTPKPITATPDAPAAEVFERMHERRIRHMPVVDESGQLVGLVSKRDLLGHARAAIHPAEDGFAGMTVADLMQEEIDRVSPECCAVEAARHMLRSKHSCLPVVEEDGALVGIITEADFVRLALRGRPACSCCGVRTA